MPKSRHSHRKMPQKRVVPPATQAAAGATVVATQPARPVSASRAAAAGVPASSIELSHVVGELKRIAIVAVMMIVILVVLYFVV